jgi:glycosyltransferase involved in cell wall biosynthesis
MATIRMARMLKDLGHHVTLYASEENDAPCDELVTIITKEEQETLLAGIPYQYAGFFGQKVFPIWALANNRTIKEIARRKQERDFILLIGGTSQQQVADAHPDLMTVEYSIGYISAFSKFRVYESHIWRAMTTARQGSDDGRFFDAVIPLFFDEDEFEYRPNKEPFALYVGRLTVKKGVEIACRAAEAAGVPLNVIGHGDESLVTHGAKYLGALSADERNEWMARASCIISPTLYMEPFGAVVIEAALCGTPAITTDFGGFVETVEHGRTGYRCSYLGEFARAIHDCAKLDPKKIRNRAVEKYSISAVAPAYQSYFDRLAMLWDKGWDTIK